MPVRPTLPVRRARQRRWLIASGAALSVALFPIAPIGAVAGTTSTSGSPADAPTDSRPYVSGDHTIPYYDSTTAITTQLEVETELDGDEDGKPDRIYVELSRPDAAPDAKLPLIVEASPYYFQGPRNSWLPSYFLPRGYAFATVSLPGTDFSSGCEDVGAELEVLGTKAIVDWANGRAKGFDATTGKPVTAKWSSGKVAMIGGSWNGTIANSVAATGVEGLETIVPIAAISSWYDYTRSYGIPFYEDHVAYLQEFVSNFDYPRCSEMTDELRQGSDDPTGSYNKWWTHRDYRPDASKITASVYVVHGLSDENVKTRQFGEWWDQLEKYGVERKLFLHQGDHLDPIQFGNVWTDRLQEWFDYYLQGIDNGVPDGPQVTIQSQDGSSWRDEPVWPPADTTDRKMKLSKPLGRDAGALTVGDTSTEAVAKTVKFTQSTPQSSDDVVSNPTTPRGDRAVFLSSSLDSQVRESGTATVSMRVKVNKPAAGFQARVVDYTSGGSAYIVSRTIADLGHYKSINHKEKLTPGKWYKLTWEINTDERIFAKGDKIGLVITAEIDNPFSSYSPVTATIKTTKSSLTMPLSGDLASLASIGSAAPVVTTQVTPAQPTRDLQEFMREFISLQ